MDLTGTILEMLKKHEGKPVVSHTITRAIAQSPEMCATHRSAIALRESWGWSKEEIYKELQLEVQIPVAYAIGKLKRNGLAFGVRIERGEKLKEQIKKKRIVFSNPRDLTLCTMAYRITNAGIKHMMATKK